MASKVVVITGASAGIGAALAKKLGSQGHQLVLAARRERELKEVAASIPGATTVVTDVTRRQDVEALRDAALKAFGRVDVWVNNAGRGISRNVMDLSDDDVDAILAVNLKSALYGAQAIVPHFKERGSGHLINVSSFLGRVPLVTIRSIYSAAKAALNSLTASLRMELAATHPGIKVSLVLPGMVATDFGKNSIGSAQFSPRPGQAPMRAQPVEEVAAVIAEVIEHPVAEAYSVAALKDTARRYREDVEAFEASLRASRG
jgi:short-subunit dehydrogenase